MIGHLANDSGDIDRRTSRAICDAVGEKLQQSLQPEARLTPYLEHLMNELKKCDRDGASQN